MCKSLNEAIEGTRASIGFSIIFIIKECVTTMQFNEAK